MQQHRFGVVYLSLRCHRNVFAQSGIKRKFQDPFTYLDAWVGDCSPDETSGETTSGRDEALAKLQEFMDGMEESDVSISARSGSHSRSTVQSASKIYRSKKLSQRASKCAVRQLKIIFSQ